MSKNKSDELVFFEERLEGSTEKDSKDQNPLEETNVGSNEFNEGGVDKDNSSVSETLSRINLLAIKAIIEPSISDIVMRRKDLLRFLETPEGRDYIQETLAKETHSIIADSLLFLLKSLEECGVDKEIREAIVIETKNLMVKNVAPSAILNLHYSLKILGLENKITEMLKKEEEIKKMFRELSEKHASLELSCYISEYKPNLPSYLCFKEDLKEIFDKIVLEDKAYSFFLLKLHDPNEKFGNRGHINEYFFSENRIKALVEALCVFLSRSLYLSKDEKLDSKDTTYEEGMIAFDNQPIDIEDFGSDDELEFLDLDEEDISPLEEVSLEKAEKTEEDFSIGTLFDKENASNNSDTDKESVVEEGGRENDFMKLLSVYKQGILDNDYLKAFSGEFHAPADEIINIGMLETMRKNAVKLLQEIRKLGKIKVYRVNLKYLIFYTEEPLDEIIKKIDGLFELFDSTNAGIDCSLAMSFIDKKMFADICIKNNMRSDTMENQQQLVYDNLMDQLKLGISSLEDAMTVFRNRYIYDSKNREFERKRLKGSKKKALEKPIKTFVNGDNDEIALDLALKIEALQYEISEVDNMKGPITARTETPVLRDRPKVAIGRCVSLGEDPFIESALEKNLSSGQISATNSFRTPKYLDFSKITSSAESLSRDQFLKKS